MSEKRSEKLHQLFELLLYILFGLENLHGQEFVILNELPVSDDYLIGVVFQVAIEYIHFVQLLLHSFGGQFFGALDTLGLVLRFHSFNQGKKVHLSLDEKPILVALFVMLLVYLFELVKV